MGINISDLRLMSEGYPNIYIEEKAFREMSNITKRSGIKDRFEGLLRLRLKFLYEYGRKCILKSDMFELLKGSDELYSMKFKKAPINIRLLFKFYDAGNGDVSIIVCSFIERDSSDYGRAIEAADRRFQALLVDGKE